jgi:hypothetical protein
MKIAKLLSMAPVFAACLALAAVSVAQIGCWRTEKTGLGMVSLRVDRPDMQKVEVSIEKNGVLRLGGDKVEAIRLEGRGVYFPGESSDRREIKIGEKGKILIGEVVAASLYFSRYGRGWDVGSECYCTNPPLPRPPRPRKIGKISLWNDELKKQTLELFLEANGDLKFGGRKVEKIHLENGVVYRPGESPEEKVVGFGKNGEVMFDGVLATGFQLVGDSVGWDSGAKRYNLGPTPLKDLAPPRE